MKKLTYIKIFLVIYDVIGCKVNLLQRILIRLLTMFSCTWTYFVRFKETNILQQSCRYLYLLSDAIKNKLGCAWYYYFNCLCYPLRATPSISYKSAFVWCQHHSQFCVWVWYYCAWFCSGYVCFTSRICQTSPSGASYLAFQYWYLLLISQTNLASMGVISIASRRFFYPFGSLL